MIAHQSFDPREFYARKPATALQPNWIEPELRDSIIPLDMDVWRFVTVSRVKEEAIRAGSQYCRHRTAPNPGLSLQRRAVRPAGTEG